MCVRRRAGGACTHGIAQPFARVGSSSMQGPSRWILRFLMMAACKPDLEILMTKVICLLDPTFSILLGQNAFETPCAEENRSCYLPENPNTEQCRCVLPCFSADKEFISMG